MIIDFHTHTLPDKIAGKAIDKLSHTSHTVPFTDGTVSGLKKSMKMAGIDLSVILPVATSPHQVEHINDSSAALNRGCAGELISFGAMHPDCENWYDELSRIRDMGIPQIVLSASEKNILSDQLISLGIAEFFSEILGLETFHTIDKTGITQVWKSRNPTAVPIVIGDTENDVKTAEILSCDCILKSGGHRSAASLSKHGYPVIDSFDKII